MESNTFFYSFSTDFSLITKHPGNSIHLVLNIKVIQQKNKNSPRQWIFLVAHLKIGGHQQNTEYFF